MCKSLNLRIISKASSSIPGLSNSIVYVCTLLYCIHIPLLILHLGCDIFFFVFSRDTSHGWVLYGICKLLANGLMCWGCLEYTSQDTKKVWWCFCTRKMKQWCFSIPGTSRVSKWSDYHAKDVLYNYVSKNKYLMGTHMITESTDKENIANNTDKTAIQY